MGRSAGVRPDCSLNNGNNSRGKQLEGQSEIPNPTAGVRFLGLPLSSQNLGREALSPGTVTTPSAERSLHIHFMLHMDNLYLLQPEPCDACVFAGGDGCFLERDPTHGLALGAYGIADLSK